MLLSKLVPYPAEVAIALLVRLTTCEAFCPFTKMFQGLFFSKSPEA